MSPTLAVLYLHRSGMGLRALTEFGAGYRSHPAGMNHDLIVLAKGFDGRLPRDHEDQLAGLGGSRLLVPDQGFDIGSYRMAARELPHDRLCFLNSHACPVVPDWLRLLNSGLDLDGVGASGASGSWMSSSTSFSWRMERPGQLPRKIAGKTLSAIQYPRFPNPHLRTNAFVIDRELFLALEARRLRHKRDAYQFESGRSSMTRQLARRGLRSVIMDRFGRAWDVAEWSSSGTFWLGEQPGLVVSDNQTRKYERASEEMRRRLWAAAWAGGVAPSDDEIAGTSDRAAM